MGRTLSSAAFLADVGKKDRAAAEELFAYAGDLLQLARARLDGHIRQKEDPEDIVQSAFKSFIRLRNAGRLDLTGKHSLLGLLVVITRRKCDKRLRKYRRAKRDIRRETNRLAGTDKGVSWISVASEATPEEAVMLAELVDKIVTGFDARERRIVTLAIEGYAQADIAADVSLSERTVRRVLLRVRKRLARLELEDDAA